MCDEGIGEGEGDDRRRTVPRQVVRFVGVCRSLSKASRRASDLSLTDEALMTREKEYAESSSCAGQPSCKLEQMMHTRTQDEGRDGGTENSTTQGAAASLCLSLSPPPKKKKKPKKLPPSTPIITVNQGEQVILQEAYAMLFAQVIEAAV